MASTIESLHDEATRFFTGWTAAARFGRTPGSGRAAAAACRRVLTEGATFEKCGVNRSAVEGSCRPQLAQRLGARAGGGEGSRFFVAGMSIVAHPRSPKVPTVHLNVRYFEIRDARRQRRSTPGSAAGPTSRRPIPTRRTRSTSTARSRRSADRHHPSFHPRFKAWCDHYFVNVAPGRGAAGRRRDLLRPPARRRQRARPARGCAAFVADVGRALPAAYGPIVERRRDEAYGERERRFQLARRGRYVEFNLVHDRGTLFGLQTQARIESVLMSLPPLAAWEYDPRYEPGSFEARAAGDAGAARLGRRIAGSGQRPERCEPTRRTRS